MGHIDCEREDRKSQSSLSFSQCCTLQSSGLPRNKIVASFLFSFDALLGVFFFFSVKLDRKTVTLSCKSTPTNFARERQSQRSK